MPDEAAAVRRLDRMYHKDLLVSEGACVLVVEMGWEWGGGVCMCMCVSYRLAIHARIACIA